MKNSDKIIELLNGGANIGSAVREVCGTQRILIPFTDELFNAPIEELRLSNRSYNSLKREKLNTLNDVIEHFTTKGWNSIKNFGKGSAKEVFMKIVDVAWDNMNVKQRARFLLSMD